LRRALYEQRVQRWRTWSKRGGPFVAIAALIGVALALSPRSSDVPSTCYGNTSRGALRNGWRLPRNGANFRAYSLLGWGAGRTFVHSTVHAVVLDAYQRLAVSQPEYRFVYGETGWAEGGSFEPHRTHENGLSVDFMVPVRDASGAIVELPSSPLDKLGYAHEFDAAGKLGALRIDFEALALHLAELERSAARQRVKVGRVIFDPQLRAQLASTKVWPDIESLPFMLKPAWIRHDEHYHVDFDVPCQPLARLP
jgi:penicillin-insensitive murein endopeptidase